MNNPRTVCWFSSGAASAVATALTLKENPGAIIAYCETGAEHEDNERFLLQCQDKFGKEIIRLRNPKFKDTWEVWEKRRYIAGIAGAPCTSELKIFPRLEFQLPDDIHVFGYTADGSDVKRAKRLRLNYDQMEISTPLIDQGLTKEACLEMVGRWGIKPPLVYSLGFQNANCIPCCKAQSPSYWALVRKEFPAEFERMHNLSKELNCRLAKIDNERVFLDEIPLDQKTTEPMQPSCDFLCHLASAGLEGEE